MTFSKTETTKTYTQRINTIFTYIDENLEGDLSLETIAKIACYSPYHFHRVFKVITHEPLNSYINRKRLENAAGLLYRNQQLSISDIYLQCGFNSAPSFTKSFKKLYKNSPSKFRKVNPDKYSKIGQTADIKEAYLRNLEQLLHWRDMNTTIAVKQVPELHFATLTQIGIQGLQNTFTNLMDWAGPKGLLVNPNFKIGAIFYDSFKVTSPDKVRMKACLLTDNSITSEDEIEGVTFISQKCIVARFEIGMQEFEQAWTGIFMWMNENGHTKANYPPYEIYHNNFNEHPEKKCIVDMCIPIK
ncbi:MAG: AraC family transcriptional regulator [Kordia sp.]|nr:MAG: AraC family transcriptional regulator [Kordia sp.]